MEQMKPIGVATWLLAACIAVTASMAYAQTAPPPAAAPAAPATTAPPASGTTTTTTTTTPAPTAAPAPPPGLWISGIHLSAQIEGGITVNPATPDNGVNFG